VRSSDDLNSWREEAVPVAIDLTSEAPH